MEIEWIGPSGWTPGGVGMREKGKKYTVDKELGDRLVEQGKAKEVKVKSKPKLKEVE